MSSNTFPVAHESIVWRRDRHVPVTPTQALMEAAAHDEPEESILEKQDRLEPIRLALESDVITDRERWVIEAIYWRGRSLSQIAHELGMAKTSIFRIREVAFEKIAKHLTANGQAPDGVGAVPVPVD
jgi:DNA-directed RNA polymerase specialized sigma subunit